MKAFIKEFKELMDYEEQIYSFGEYCEETHSLISRYNLSIDDLDKIKKHPDANCIAAGNWKIDSLDVLKYCFEELNAPPPPLSVSDWLKKRIEKTQKEYLEAQEESKKIGDYSSARGKGGKLRAYKEVLEYLNTHE